MTNNALISSLPGILFDNAKAEALNKFVKEKVDKSLFLFYHYTPDILIPPNPDGKYFMGVSNLYKLVKDAGWVLENSGKICGKNFRYYSPDLKKQIEIIHLLREIQNHNTRQDNKLKIQQAENWWQSAGIFSQRPQSVQDYEKILIKLEKLGESLMTEALDFITHISKLPTNKKNIAIETWKDEIIKRYIKERHLFEYSINMYKKYFLKCNRKKHIDIITSYFIYDYYTLRNEERHGVKLYSNQEYKKAVENYAKQKIDDINKHYNLALMDINDLASSIHDKKQKYINIFYKYILQSLLCEASKEENTLELDSLCKNILEKTKTITLTIDGKSIPIKNISYFDIT